jgi:hypothetical protein
MVANATYTAPTPSLGLWTSTVTDASTAATAGELTYTTYARQSISSTNMSPCGVGIGDQRRGDHVPGGHGRWRHGHLLDAVQLSLGRGRQHLLGHRDVHGDLHDADAADRRDRRTRHHPRLSPARDAACDMCRTIAEQDFNSATARTRLDGTGTDALLLPNCP